MFNLLACINQTEVDHDQPCWQISSTCCLSQILSTNVWWSV